MSSSRDSLELGTRNSELETELAQTIMAAAERASGLVVRVGLADGKFAAYVAAMGADGSFESRVPSFEDPSEYPTRDAEPETRNSELARRGGTYPLPRTSGSRGQAPPPRGSHNSRVPRIVLSNKGAEFLAHLPVEDLPVSAEMRRRLSLFGLRTVGEFSRLPRGAVTAQFGAEGARAWELAHGIDREPIISYRPPVTITERLAFPSPVDTVDVLLVTVQTLIGRALHRPQSRGRAVRGLRLLVHLEGGHTWERKVSFREPVGSGERMLVVLKPKIEGAELSAPFTEVELSLLGLCGESALQGNLFTTARGRQLERVAEAARQLKARYGRPILAKVVEVEPWSRIPERRFALIDYDP